MEKIFDIKVNNIGKDNKEYITEYTKLHNDIIMKQIRRRGYMGDIRPWAINLTTKNDGRVDLESEDIPQIINKLDDCFFDDLNKGAGIRLLYSHSMIDVGIVDNKFVYGLNENSTTNGLTFVPNEDVEEISEPLMNELKLLLFAGQEPNRDLLSENNNDMEM